MDYNNISKKELNKMTSLSCDVVNSIHFSNVGPHEVQCAKFDRLLESLESRYGDNELVSRARDSFDGLSRKKLDFYRFTRDMIRMTKEPLEYGKAENDQLEEELPNCA